MSKEENRYLLEYSLFEVEDVESILEVREYIQVFLDDCLDYLESFKSIIKRNNRQKKIAVLSNYFAFIIGYEFPEGYDEDNAVVKDEVKMCNDFKKIVKRLCDVLNKDNYKDIFKLMEFIRTKFLELYHYHERRRDAVELSFSGVGLYIPKDFDMNEFHEFCDSEIKRISLNNSIEKQKLM